MSPPSRDSIFGADGIIDAVRQPILVLSSELRVLKVNASFLRTFHLRPEKAVDQFLYDLDNGQWDFPFLRNLLETVRNANPIQDDSELDHVFPALGRRVMLINARRVTNTDDKSASIVLAFEDITARREAEASVQAAETTFTALIRSMKDHSIFLLDADGIVTTWNAEAERNIGYQQPEIVGRSFGISFIPEDVHAGLPQNQLRLARENGYAEDERWIVRKDGSRFWGQGVVVPLCDAKGSITGFSQVVRDMTDRQQKETALQASEVRYRRLFQTAKDGILILDAETGEILDANPFMSRLLGFEPAHFLGKQLWEIGLFTDIEANQAAFRELQVRGYLRYDHLPLKTRDERKVEVEFISNTYEADGKLVIQCNIRDCSERSRLEHEIRVSLEEKVVLLKEVHHRVKNNLQVISSLLHLQSQHTRDPASVRMFRESQNRVRSMALVHERLYRSKDLARVDFAGYIESLVPHLFNAYHVDVDRIRLAVNVQGVKLPIDAAIPCGLLLNELISNCLKHAFQGRDRGHIRIELLLAAGGQIALSVNDDGVGIAEGIGPHAAKTFGMQLISDLVAQLHGSVQLDRKGGTTVRILFPAAEEGPVQRKDRS